MSIEVMKQALDALGAYMEATDSEQDEKAHNLMATVFFKLKEAIEQAEKQEPFGWVSQHTVKGPYEWQFNKELSGVYRDNAISILPVYTTPQPQQAEKQEPVAWIDCGDLELMSKHGRGCIAWGTQQNNANTPLYTTLPTAPVQEPVIDHSCKDTYELIMKWADIYAAQTGNLYAQAAQDPSKVARMADERTILACVVAQAFPPPEPDLLNALKRIVDEPNNTMSDGKALKEIIRIARAAINKATGEKT